jgi:putative ABC transport system substrate-binding protein
MERRTFLGVIAAWLLAAPLVAEAQSPGKVPRIGVLVPVEPDDPKEPNVSAFRQALRDLGYVQGQNIAVDYEYARGRSELYAELASQLVRLNVDVMVVGSDRPVLAAKQVTQTIPIVGVGMGYDPVREGIVSSLAQPGGNVTGLTFATGGKIVGKFLQLLKEAAPGIRHVGYLRDADTPAYATFLADAQAAGQDMGLQVRPLDVMTLNEVEKALAQMSKERGGALIVTGGLFTMSAASDITRLAAKHRLPAIYGARAFMASGGLMSHSPSLPDLWRCGAIYADKVLRGAKPADLPVEQPTKFELVINLKTAKALGLTIPPSLLLRADEVIQ